MLQLEDSNAANCCYVEDGGFECCFTVVLLQLSDFTLFYTKERTVINTNIHILYFYFLKFLKKAKGNI